MALISNFENFVIGQVKQGCKPVVFARMQSMYFSFEIGEWPNLSCQRLKSFFCCDVEASIIEFDTSTQLFTALFRSLLLIAMASVSSLVTGISRR